MRHRDLLLSGKRELVFSPFRERTAGWSAAGRQNWEPMLQPEPCPWITSLTLLAGPAAFREHTLDGPNVGCVASSPGHLSGWHPAHLQGDLAVSPRARLAIPGSHLHTAAGTGSLEEEALPSCPLSRYTATCLRRPLQPSVCQTPTRAREKHWLVSHQNAKGTVLYTPCQLTAQKNKELGNRDTLASWRPWKVGWLSGYWE